MLVLSRHKNESVFIELPNGELIKVMIVDIRDGCKVRLGFEAPTNIPVHREEVYHTIKKGNPMK
jgi:carbon storage regulator